MLDACRHFNPAMHAFFIHREGGRGKGWICERSHGDDDAVFATLANVVHRGAAGGAEVECGPAAAIADPNEGVRCPGDGHRACRKSRLRREHAAGPALAGQAVANGNADRLGRRDGRELAARATGGSGGHIELCRFLGRHIIYIQFQCFRGLAGNGQTDVAAGFRASTVPPASLGCNRLPLGIACNKITHSFQ